MTKDELRAFLLECGWKENRWGKLEKERTYRVGKGVEEKRLTRIGFGKIAFRMEVISVIPESTYCREQRVWTKIGGDYYSRIIVESPTSIIAGRHRFRLPEPAKTGPQAPITG